MPGPFWPWHQNEAGRIASKYWPAVEEAIRNRAMSRQVRGRARVECRSADFWAYWLNLGGAWCDWDWSTQPPPTGSISAFAADQKIERAIGYRARTNVGGERMDHLPSAGSRKAHQQRTRSWALSCAL